MTDGHVVADRHGESAQRELRVGCEMQKRSVLDVRARPDADRVYVSAHHATGSDRHVVADLHVAGDLGRRIDISKR